MLKILKIEMQGSGSEGQAMLVIQEGILWWKKIYTLGFFCDEGVWRDTETGSRPGIAIRHALVDAWALHCWKNKTLPKSTQIANLVRRQEELEKLFKRIEGEAKAGHAYAMDGHKFDLPSAEAIKFSSIKQIAEERHAINEKVLGIQV